VLKFYNATFGPAAWERWGGCPEARAVERWSDRYSEWCSDEMRMNHDVISPGARGRALVRPLLGVV
jgi:hypothetical protein